MTTDKTRYVGVKYIHDKMVAHSPKKRSDWQVQRWMRIENGWSRPTRDSKDINLFHGGSDVTYRIVQLDE